MWKRRELVDLIWQLSIFSLSIISSSNLEGDGSLEQVTDLEVAPVIDQSWHDQNTVADMRLARSG